MITGATGRSRPLDGWLWIAAALSLGLSLTRWGQPLLYPFKIFTTWVHECGHAVMTLLVGGSVTSIAIASDTSGVTWSWIPAGRIASGLVASSGYLGASLVGCLLLAATRVPNWAPAILRTVGAFMVVTLAVWIRNPFGFVAVLAWAVALVALSGKATGSVARFVLSLLAIQVALGAVYDIRGLFLLDIGDAGNGAGNAGNGAGDAGNGAGYDGHTAGGRSDADTMARLFLLPSWVWASVWMVASVALLVGTLWTTRVRGSVRTPVPA